MAELLLFNKYSMSNIEVTDEGLKKYINLKPILLPFSGGRHANQRFKKNEVHIVERFINKLMRKGDNAGKKQMITKAVETAFEMIELKTDTNPVQIMVNALVNAAPREETTRVSYGGVAQHQAVDVAPLRRVDLSLRFLTDGILKTSFSNIKTLPEIIADELIAGANNDSASKGVKKKQELERIAYSAR
jgi:small subunit ribosomal protein S7